MAMTSQSDEFERMINVGHTERLLSLVGGGVLAVLGMRRPTVGGAAMALAGGALVARGLTGYCPAKSLINSWTGDGAGDHARLPNIDTDPGRDRFSRHPGDIYADCDKEIVDEASQESFPASDPPSFTPGVAR